ncbi:MAG: hypothetical protein WKG01_01795 [Kofleriaceae bacterium]
MSNHETASIRRLVAECIDSYEKLAIVVRLSRTRGAPQTAAELAAASALPVELVAEALTALTRDGLVRSTEPNDGGWSIDPSGSRAATVDALARLHDQTPVDVLRMMSEVAMERVRSLTARRFADAFLVSVKKKKEDPDA